MVVPWIMTFLWRNHMGKEADLMFTVTVGIPFWGFGEHEPLIITLFLPVVSWRNWRGPWKIKGSDWTYGTAISVDLECKRELEKPGTVPIEGKLRQVSEEDSEKSWNILRKLLVLGAGNTLHFRWCGAEVVTQIILNMISPRQGRIQGDTRKGG